VRRKVVGEDGKSVGCGASRDDDVSLALFGYSPSPRVRKSARNLHDIGSRPTSVALSYDVFRGFDYTSLLKQPNSDLRHQL
jgi:hypothetical protein